MRWSARFHFAVELILEFSANSYIKFEGVRDTPRRVTLGRASGGRGGEPGGHYYYYYYYHYHYYYYYYYYYYCYYYYCNTNVEGTN